MTIPSSVTISIHALREEGDADRKLIHALPSEFLSTPSARRATRRKETYFCKWDISIHALREEGDTGAGSCMTRTTRISIHALREEGDVINIRYVSLPTNFYPRPPRGGRPADIIILQPHVRISIHALREEGDVLAQPVYLLP